MSTAQGRLLLVAVVYITYDMLKWAGRSKFLDSDAKAEVDQLSVDLRAKFERIVTLIKLKGLEQVREPYVKHLDGKLWEIRMIGKDTIARSIYVTAPGRRIVVLHTFIKKTYKTPSGALNVARRRAKEVG